jgi:hypothetical protein
LIFKEPAMNKTSVWTAILILILAVPLGAATKIVSPGDFFPPHSFRADISSADAAYLGVAEVVGRSGEFQVEDIWGEILVLELFNRFCFGCQQGAPLLNRVYEMVASDPSLSTRVRFIGVGVGNNMKTVNDFRREFDVLFPLVPDPQFEILNSLGNPGGTPYTMVLRRTTGGLMLMAAHFGVLDSAEEFVDEIREISAGNTEELLANARQVELPPWLKKELVPPISETEIESLVLKSMDRAGYGSVGLYTVDLPDGERIFIGESKRGKVFTRVISRLPVCDVCHPVHFILTLNPRGLVVDFDAINVTKYWNKEWNPRRRLLGLSALEERDFDPEVDAVSTATMSSSLIYNSLGNTGPIVKLLKEKGHL